jgi:hypothetical protein
MKACFDNPQFEMTTLRKKHGESIACSISISTSMKTKRCFERTPGPDARRLVDENQSSKRRKIQKHCSEENATALSSSIELEHNTLPDPKGPDSPDKFLQILLRAQYGLTMNVKPSTELCDFFPTATEEQIAAYTTQIVSAARKNEVSELRRLCDAGSSMKCFNRFGETLLHMACRRGFKDMVEFLLEQPAIGVRVVDDCGRSPIHDLCWNPTPQLEICKWIMERDPSLFFVSDRRGFSPFDYARPQHWNIWKQFLLDNKGCFEKMTESTINTRFS